MSHGIYTDRDFQISEQMAWHKLTTIATPARESFPEIVEAPVYYGDNKVVKTASGAYVVPISVDDNLPVAPPYCKGTYTLFTPRQAWDWVHEILSGTGFAAKSIGMLWNRSFWFMGVELNELNSLKIGDGRDSIFNLNFSGGLDKSVSPQAEVSSILPVCWNTISLSRMSGEVLFKEKATKNFATKLDAAKSEVEKAVGMTAIFQAAMGKLAEKPCSSERAQKIYTGYLSGLDAEITTKTVKNRVEVLTGLHKNGLGNRGETEFDLLNAYTQLLTRGNELETGKISPGKRFASSEFGGGADSKADFASLLTTRRAELVKVERHGAKLLSVG